jgi:hypothetical protein
MLQNVPQQMTTWRLQAAARKPVTSPRSAMDDAFGGVRPAQAVPKALLEAFGGIRPAQKQSHRQPSPSSPQAPSCDQSRRAEHSTSGRAPREARQKLRIPTHLALRIPDSQAHQMDSRGGSYMADISGFGSVFNEAKVCHWFSD